MAVILEALNRSVAVKSESLKVGKGGLPPLTFRQVQLSGLGPSLLLRQRDSRAPYQRLSLVLRAIRPNREWYNRRAR
jgi:hypothetical protein